MLASSPKELALLIKDQRKKLKLSQAAVGKLVGLKQQTVSDFENRPENTAVSTLFRIIAAVNLDIDIIKKQAVQGRQWTEEW